MKLTLTLADLVYEVDTDNAVSLAISLKFNDKQPNHFGADIATKESLQGGGFIGDTKRGGSCNVDSITLVPHCNGTHTESIAHIVHEQVSIGQNNQHSLTLCQLISVTPIDAKQSNDSYLPELQSSDKVIDLACLKSQIKPSSMDHIESLVIRTLPNKDNKLSAIYGEDNQPPFFTHQAISWLSQSGIKHLLVDMPSIDKMYDDGQLSNHHIFWRVEPNSRLLNDESRPDRTITEMIYVDNKVTDGLYCLNLQIPAFELDAAPSRPILYPLNKI
jgi:kynurenine formamidase